MAIYETCGKDVVKIGDEMLRKFHTELADVGVTICYLYAYAPKNDATGEPRGPALKFAGWPAAAIVKVNSLKDRVEGKADATIILDGDNWKDRPTDEQKAIIDHEQEHLELKLDEDGHIQTDDCGRPKLKLRPHDWQLGGFDAIVKRHSQAALEAQSYVDLSKRFSQKEFNWG